MAKLTKGEKRKIREEKKKNGETLAQQFKKFITRGNILDMSVGVIMGGAFNAIVNAFTKILMSVATWGVPGGINGLVTVLPAANEAQRGAEIALANGNAFVQKFSTAEVNEMVIGYAKAQGADITVTSDTFNQWKTSLLSLYSQHGTTWTYNQSAVIDWGTFINAIISFLTIALTLFVIIKVTTYVGKKRAEFKAQLEMKVAELKATEEARKEDDSAE